MKRLSIFLTSYFRVRNLRIGARMCFCRIVCNRRINKFVKCFRDNLILGRYNALLIVSYIIWYKYLLTDAISRKGDKRLTSFIRSLYTWACSCERVANEDASQQSPIVKNHRHPWISLYLYRSLINR